ncbi:MAG TPA: TIR domain-containing protein [Thermoanaerobaculia bacterium]|jgi:hypothetical protein
MPLQLFLSHIHEEAQLALRLKRWIETTFSDRIEVFVSSDRGAFARDANWLRKLSGALRTTDLLLLLASPRSLQRPWINFEAGCAWVRDTDIIPLCHSGQRKEALPLPLSLFNAVEILEPSGCEEFLEGLRIRLQETHLAPVSFTQMAQELRDSATDDERARRAAFRDPLDGLPYTLLENFCKIYQAEDLPGRLSAIVRDPEASTGQARHAFVEDRVEHLVFGPYAPLEKNGKHVAFFGLKLGEIASFGPVALLDVVGGHYATRHLYGGDFPKRASYHTFAVYFVVDELRDMEYRVLAEPHAGDTWIDFIAVASIGDLPPRLRERAAIQ